MHAGRITAVCISEDRGTPKQAVQQAMAIRGRGLEGDAHAGMAGALAHRQVSLLAQESANVIREKGLDVPPGGFAENLRTEGVDLKRLPLGTALRVGDEALLRVTQIGKECHSGCAIYEQVGDCVMPREGVFTEVVEGGVIRTGDTLSVMPAAVVITVSDRSAAGVRKDESGPAVVAALAKAGFSVAATEVVPDDRAAIERRLRHFARCASVIVTTGGTGVGPRDVTPEATRSVITQELPGFGEAMRRVSFDVTPRAILSRATAGVCGRCLIVNVPGSPKGARECLEIVLPAMHHALDMLAGLGH